MQWHCLARWKESEKQTILSIIKLQIVTLQLAIFFLTPICLETRAPLSSNSRNTIQKNLGEKEKDQANESIDYQRQWFAKLPIGHFLGKLTTVCEGSH